MAQYTRVQIRVPACLPSSKMIDNMYVPNMVKGADLPTKYFTKIVTGFTGKYAAFVSAGDMGDIYIPKTVLHLVVTDKTVLSEEFKNNFFLQEGELADVVKMGSIEEDLFLSAFGRKISIDSNRVFDVLQQCDKYNIGYIINYIVANLDVSEFCLACEYDRQNVYRFLNSGFIDSLCTVYKKKSSSVDSLVNKLDKIRANAASYDDICCLDSWTKIDIPKDKIILVPHDHAKIPSRNVFMACPVLNTALLQNLQKTEKYKIVSALHDMYTIYLGEITEDVETPTCSKQLAEFFKKVRPLLFVYEQMDNILAIV